MAVPRAQNFFQRLPLMTLEAVVTRRHIRRRWPSDLTFHVSVSLEVTASVFSVRMYSMDGSVSRRKTLEGRIARMSDRLPCYRHSAQMQGSNC